jgi:hypothetical protein
MDYRSVRVEGGSSEPSSQRANHYRSTSRLCSSILTRSLAVLPVARLAVQRAEQREPLQVDCSKVLSSVRDVLLDQVPHHFVDWL